MKGKEADFADALVVNKSKQVAKKENIPFNGSFTFDLAAQTLPGLRLQNDIIFSFAVKCESNEGLRAF